MVSIPFKRETSSKLEDTTSVTNGSVIMFQFPSNGKLLPNSTGDFVAVKPFFVSIPFKRETSSKLGVSMKFQKGFKTCFNSLQTGNFFQTFDFGNTGTPRQTSFNSLQTGNFFQTRVAKEGFRADNLRVSIPFKRETSSKPVDSDSGSDSGSGFQFPSNGKLLPNLAKACLSF